MLVYLASFAAVFAIHHSWLLIFFYAFQEARVGRPQYLDDLERRMFEALGV